MAICFKAFLERAPNDLRIRWTSIFMRTDSSEHEVVVDCSFSRGVLRLPYKNYYGVTVKYMTEMQRNHENITSFSVRRTVLSGLSLHVKTLIDTRHN